MSTKGEWLERKIKSGTMEFISDGYLYSMQTGTISVRQGEVYHRHDISRFNHLHLFVYDPDYYGHVQCSTESGAIHNKALWLPERDDKKAIDIFVKNEQLKIEELEKEIKRREQAIKVLSITEVI